MDVPVPETRGRGSAASAYIHVCVVCLLSLLRHLKKVKFCFSINALCTQDGAHGKYLCETYEKGRLWKSESAYPVTI